MINGEDKRSVHTIRWIVFFLLTVVPQIILAKNLIVLSTDTVVVSKTGEAEEIEKIGEYGEIGEIEETKIVITTMPFKPNPRTATIAAAIFPGLGQIYNRQYWKLPIVYGGLMGCLYAITWNNKTYADYKEAYFSIMNDSKADPQAEHPEDWSDRWQVFVPGNIDPATRLHDGNFHNNLKRGKDYFRRYRELSWIVLIAVYGITVADAYVDAQMFDFDVSPDLSFHVTPLFLPETLCHSRSYGITICMNF